MKKILLASFLMATTAVAASADTFYEKQTGNWFVFGDRGDQELNPACVISYEWQDGSEFQLIYDLQERVLDIWFENFEWNISDPADRTYSMDMVIVGNGNNMTNGEMQYYLEDKNSIYISDIQPIGTFLESFSAFNELRFIMPGNIENAYLDLEGSRNASTLFLECVDKGVQLKLNKTNESVFQNL